MRMKQNLWIVALISALTLGATIGVNVDTSEAFEMSPAAQRTLEQMINPAGKISLLPLQERTAPAVSKPGFATIYADSVSHLLKMSINGGAYATLQGLNVADPHTWTELQTFMASPGIDLNGTAPSFTLTDTTASAKSLTIAVDANLAQLRESAGASGSLLVLDLANNRVGIRKTPGAFSLDIDGNNSQLALSSTTGEYASLYFSVGGVFRSGLYATATDTSLDNRGAGKLILGGGSGEIDLTIDTAGNVEVAAALRPITNGVSDLGSGTLGFKRLYLSDSGDATCGAGKYWIAANTSTTTLRKCQNGTITDLDTGGGGGAPTTATYLTATSEAGLSAEVNLGALTTGLLKHTVSGGISTPATATAGTDYTSPSSSETFTNKTLSAEGTGNVLTVPLTYWVPAAGCNNATAGPVIDLPTANAPAAACVTGTNTQKGVLDFDATTDESGQFTFRLPSDWTGNIDVTFLWFAAATSGATGWCLQLAPVADAETDDPAFPAQGAGNCVSDTAKGTTLQVNTATISAATCTGCAAGELLHAQISRDANGSAVTDDMTGDARLIGVELTYRRAM